MSFILRMASKLWAGFDPSSLPTLKTHVRYYKPLDIHKHEKPYECEFDVSAVENARRTNIEVEDHDVLVHEIRGFQQHFTLERNGFEIIYHRSALTRDELGSRTEIETRYFDECKQMVQRRFKASQVLILGFNIRDNAPGNTNKFKGALRPAKIVHVDQSPAALFARLEQQFGKEKAEDLAKKHKCIIVNVWRPLSDPVNDYPLGWCDIQTVQQSDCVAFDLVKREDYVGESLYLRHNPKHRFYYISQQRPNEVTLMKMAESDPAHPGAFSQGLPHTAFPLPLDKDCLQPPPRESIEVRSLVLV